MSGQKYKIPPAKPYFPEEDLDKILLDIRSVLQSGMLTIWKKTEEFENAWKDYTKAEHAVALNSGTAALHLSLRALNIKQGDEVLVPTNTFSATAASTLMVGARPVFVDMNTKNYCIDITDLNEKITPKTKAIIPVHHSGNMPDMEALLQISHDSNIPIIEDAAHAHGSLYNGKHAGNFGIAGCFSFYPTKNITTAEGGMLITNDESIAKRVRVMRDQGKPEFFSMDVVDLGYAYRLDELSSIVGIYQLKHLEEWVQRRNEIAEKFTKTIRETQGLHEPHVAPEVRHSFYKYMVLVDEGLKRDDIRAKLKEKGISSSLQYDPLVHQLSYYRQLGYTDENIKCPNSIKMAKRIFSFPTYNGMSDEEVDYVCNGLLEVMKRG
jgi:perosamine synthetase